MIARRTPTTLKIMRDLWTCPDDVRVSVSSLLTPQIAGCEKYKLTSYHEQTAVQQFILPSYREGEDWVAAPADEADGWPHGASAVLALADVQILATPGATSRSISRIGTS